MKQEEADDEEIEQETGIIRVQIGFAIQMQGSRDREAQTIYNSVRAHYPVFSRILELRIYENTLTKSSFLIHSKWILIIETGHQNLRLGKIS